MSAEYRGQTRAPGAGLFAWNSSEAPMVDIADPYTGRGMRGR
jgi:hypothetical protein